MAGEAKVWVIVPDGKEIKMGCKLCGREISSTKDRFMLGVTVDEGRQHHRYFIAVDPPIICCGEEKKIIKTFETEEEVEREKDRVVQYLNTRQSTEGLKLLSFSHYGMN